MHFRSSVVIGCLLSTARPMISSSSINQSLPDEQVQISTPTPAIVAVSLVGPFNLNHCKLLLDVEFAAVPRVGFLLILHRYHGVVRAAIDGSVNVNVPQFRCAILPVLSIEDVRPSLDSCMRGLDVTLVPTFSFTVARRIAVPFNDVDLHGTSTYGDFNNVKFVTAHS